MLGRAVWSAAAVTVLTSVVFSAVQAAETGPSPWQKPGDPTLLKALELAPNALPSASNFDCSPTTVYRYKSSTPEQDCMVSVPFGQVGANGIAFNGTTESVPVVPQWPIYGLQAIPHQGMLIAYSSAPIIGNYLHFYTSIRDKISQNPEYVNGRWQYTIVGAPDFTLKGPDGGALVINQNTMAFSPNGSWMVLDSPWQGMVRVNLATMQVFPFAPSLQQVNNYSDQRAQVTVSNDGQQVVFKPTNLDFFKVYNLADCTSTTLPVAPGNEICGSRNYWSYLKAHITGLRAIYQPRLINATQISFTAVYDFAPNNFKVAQYTMTAPGEPDSGIQYLGVGDSFASGEGAFAYAADTDTANNRCHLSTKNYAHILSGQLFTSGHAVSCSGAVMSDLVNLSLTYAGQVQDGKSRKDRTNTSTIFANYTPGYFAQTEFIDQYKPQAVTVSIGGNDIGFSSIIRSCVSPVSLPESCYPTYEDRLELARQVNSIFDRLVATYKTISKPGKRVYVIGYPQIAYAGGDCAVNVQMDDHEIIMSNDLIEYLNLVIQRAADKAGVRYVDVSEAFAGHRLCETVSHQVAVNGFTAGTDGGIGPLKFGGSESYHPNELGHVLFANSIRRQTDNLLAPMPAPRPGSAPPSLPVSLDARNLPKSGRQTNTVVTGADIAPDLLVRDHAVNVFVDAGQMLLRGMMKYHFVLHSSPVHLGEAATDASGNLTATVHIPATVPPGFHTLHVYGPNMLGQPIDIVKTVYVAASDTDYNGNGVVNADDPCPLVQAAGLDTDKDGTDDACDGTISNPVSQPSQASARVHSATLTGNSITVNSPRP